MKSLILLAFTFSMLASAQTNPSPNMNMPIPIPGITPGPQWAQSINSSFLIIDQHNHSPGQGVLIQPNGININTNLPFNNNNAISLRTTRFTSQNAPISNTGSDIGELYVAGNEIYYNDVSGGHQIQITSNGSVNAGAGSITGLPSGTASASFSAGTFVWQSATNTAANMDAGSYILRNASANSHSLTLSPPAAMGADITETLPTVPAATGLVTMDSSGNMSASLAQSTAGLSPAGAVIMYGGASAPTGWLLCDGSAVSRSTYSALFAVIGTTYGSGNGSTTFNVPNAQGVFVRGAGSQTISAKSYSGTRGQTNNDAFASHHHALWGATNGGALAMLQNSGSEVVAGATGSAPFGYIVNAPSGGNQYVQDTGSGSETFPANIVLTYIIKY